MDDGSISRARTAPGDSKKLLVIAWILATFGVGWIVGGAVWTVQSALFVAKAATSTGVVIGNVPQGKMGCPQIRFRTVAGKDVSFVEQNACARPPRYRANATVTVLYEPDAPGHAAIRSFDTLWIGPVVMDSMGVTSFLIGLECFAFRRKRNKRLGIHAKPRPLHRSESLLALPRFFIVIGVAGIVVAIPWTITRKQFLAKSATAPGVVIANEYYYSARYAEYCPKVQFRAPDGKNIVFVELAAWGVPPVYHVNAPVTVVYSPDNPEHASIQSFQALWSGPVVSWSIGLICLIVGLRWFRSVRRMLGGP